MSNAVFMSGVIITICIVTAIIITIIIAVLLEIVSRLDHKVNDLCLKVARLEGRMTVIMGCDMGVE